MNSSDIKGDQVTVELLGWVQGGIERMCRSAEGLSEAQARTPVVPSGWTVAGLLGHVHDCTYFWLHNVVAAHPMEFDADDVWDNDPDVPIAQLVDRLSTDTQRCCVAVQGISSLAVPGWWPDGAWGGYRQDTVLGVLLHLLNEIASHSGHLDLARELLDGGVWDYGIGGIRRPEGSTN
jgi:uncharacterized damage-inducible protein DinB